MVNRLSLEWRAPGPVAAAFMRSTARTPILNGPIGSGKTTTCFIKAIRAASRQQPSTRDGLRKFKLCVVRDTYRQLWKTTLPSWFKRVPRAIGEFTGAENAPANYHLQFALADNTIVDFSVDFVAIGENRVEDVLRGYEPTAFYLNEADLLAREVFTYANGRVGRYPDMEEGGPSWRGIFMDCNAPELSAWLYLDVFRKAHPGLQRGCYATPEGIELFCQPSGLDPAAENLNGLDGGVNYYLEQMKTSPEWYIKRMIENVPGYSRGGKPIYPEFSDSLHMAGVDLAAIPGIGLQIGLDAGLNPAAAIGQRMPNGQWRIVDELVGESGTGAMRFGDMLARLLHDRYAGWKNVKAYADPSAQDGVDKQAGEQSWIEIVSVRAGIRVVPAPTNLLIPRLEAVRRPLTMLIDGKPALQLSARCTILREGFNSGYRYRKIRGSELERYDDEPEKNEYSHPHDALQYLCSGGGEDSEIRDRKGRQSEAVRGARHEHEWDPLATA